MIDLKGLVRLGSALGLFAFVLSLGAVFASTASAQNPPATFYGTATADDVIEALIGGTSCGTATAGSDGFWMLQIGEDAACSPADGDTVSFTVNGAAADETEMWQAGGAPADVANGVTLTVSEETGTTPVTPPETGNAGLFAEQSGSSSPWLALSLSVLALAMVAGARSVTARR